MKVPYACMLHTFIWGSDKIKCQHQSFRFSQQKISTGFPSYIYEYIIYYFFFKILWGRAFEGLSQQPVDGSGLIFALALPGLPII